jgi:serine/threonine protein kinase/tetratricopeptide (TPR) repeat protein
MQQDGPERDSKASALGPGARVDHYRLIRQIGEGGMGVVYEAHDERLDRRVALKWLRGPSADRDRLVREAQIAARVVHPLICQVYELGESAEGPFIAMELVTGESLANRLARGPLPPVDALQLAAGVLDALAVLHEHAIVHRDLKPSNVFVTRTGIKLLDFGVARSASAVDDVTRAAGTTPGMFVGTPQYASPEQLTGGAVDARSDVFSAAVMAFEMLSGRPPFAGATFAALVHAVVYEAPPVLTGSPAVVAADRVLHRGLAKSPSDRYESAAAFARDLRQVLSLADIDRTIEARPIVRLAVLPFRQLKPDAETAYLGPSLADALSGALTGLESLVVRSTLKSARYAQAPLDLERLASDLAVDVVLTGSLLASRGRIRVAAELVSVPAGDVWWSHVTDAAPDAVLEVHNDLAGAVLDALPISARDKRPVLSDGRPRSDKAFDLYLRGMQLRAEAGAWRQAHSLMVRSLETDAGFAAAWAERGRLERLLAKYEDPALLADAETSFQKALALDPESGAAQYYYAQLEVDVGRVDAALERLLARARQRRAEPHVYAALVHACRYGGLLDASVAAHRLASHLDPTVGTSVLHTYYLQGDYARALDEAHRSSDPFEARLLGAMGRHDDARRAAAAEETRFAAVPLLRVFASGMRAALAGDRAGTRQALALFEASRFTDGEGLFYVAEIYAAAGLVDESLAMLERAIAAGFVCRQGFERDPYLAPVRASHAWPAVAAALDTAQRRVQEVFDRHGGGALLAR